MMPVFPSAFARRISAVARTGVIRSALSLNQRFHCAMLRIVSANPSQIEQVSSPPELIRLAGSLERLPNQTKTELANLFIDVASDLAREKKHCAPYLAALGHILSRAPLYAGPETVVSPELVERAYETFRRFDWVAPELAEMPGLFLRAARVVGNRSFDLPKALRHQIAAKLQNIGVAPQKTAKLKDFMPVGGSERISLHDENLPAGLILTES